MPHKNKRLVAGRPLISYTIDVALAVDDLLHSIVLTTDDLEIAELGRDAGLDVPFMRPPELSGDSVPTFPVVQHALDFVEVRDGVRMDWVLLLQPTAPLRSEADVRGAIDVAACGDYDSIASVVELAAHHPMLAKRIVDGMLKPFCLEEAEGTRRQDLTPPAYFRNGAIYLVSRDTVERGSLRGESIGAYVMPEERSVNVDSELDILLASELLAGLDER